MKRQFYFAAWLACLACIIAPAHSYWQSRDSGYNVSISGVVSTTWNPATKGSGATLSNGNLTVTGDGTANASALSTTTRSGGRFYFEMTYGGGVSFLPVSWYAGIIDTGGTIFPIGWTFAATDAWNGSASGTALHPVSGATGSVAIDMPNKTIWFRQSVGNNWNGNPAADPANNIGGADFSSGVISGNFNFVVVLQDANGESVTVNVGASAFADTMPVGFSGWN